MDSVDRVIADALGIDIARITDALEYQSIPEWNSLGHVALMVAIEKFSGVRIDDDLTLSLRSAAAIREFLAAGPSVPGAQRVLPPRQPTDAAQGGVRRGLDGVVLDRTAITRIDGISGILEYRGYSIHDLVLHANYEEVACLLLDGDLPRPGALGVFRKELAARRDLPQPVLGLIRSLVDAHPMDVLRTCVSALGALAADSRSRDETLAEARDAGLSLLAKAPMIVAAHHALRNGRDPFIRHGDSSYAESFLTAMLGTQPSMAAVRLIDKCLIIHADHSSNASTLAVRVAVGSHAGIVAAVTAAMAVFAGSLHGGAAERAVNLVDEVGAPENAERYVADCFARGEPVMGFGHRVYRTEDPRVRHLRQIVVELSDERRDPSGLAILDAVAAAMRPYDRHGLAPNVDLYAGLAYRLIGLPDDLATALFAVGRMAGWLAHALEQQSNNVLIRPLLDYQGPSTRPLSGRTA